MEPLRDCPRTDADRVTVTIFISRITRTITTTVRRFLRKKPISSSIPIEIKKRPVKLSLKGSMSEMAWEAYSDSEMIIPARKATRARESPNREVRSAVLRHNKRMVMTKRARLLILTTWWRKNAALFDGFLVSLVRK